MPRPTVVRAVVGALAMLTLVAGCGGAAPTAVPSSGPAGAAVEIRLVAKEVAFTPTDVGAPAGIPLHIVLDNQDDGIPHDIALLGVDGATKLGATEIVPGPATAEMDVPGLVPGAYRLLCEVHPNMVTNLTVGG
jgi:plastocyanin